jgi:aminoglycoside phosphotransferase family enzyme/predicted kinase
MELAELIEALSRPEAYPGAVEHVEVRHTHISVVFLAGSFAYKVKKPVNLGFLDFSTLEKRHHFCEEEVGLNRRLAPTVYLGVVPITRTAAGIGIDSPSPPKGEVEEEILDWAVKMERLPEEATLSALISKHSFENEDDEQRKKLLALVTSLAKRVARFHAEAETSDHVSWFGRPEVVAQNIHENFEQAEPLVGVTLSRAVFDRLKELSEETLAHLWPLMESRAQRHVPRDTHGDLHLDHVYIFPDHPPPGDLVIVDCIEFNERFRFADPVSDIAFLYMDFQFHGRRDLAEQFANEYFQASRDQEGRELLSFYAAYRAAVRGKVEGFELGEEEVPDSERAQALTRARAHWLLALGQLESPSQRPCLLLVAGLPGSGKSTLARTLSERADFSLIRSDVVRKELADSRSIWSRLTLPWGNRAGTRGKEIYSQAWTDRTYAECLDRAEKLLFQGKRVLIDATFREEKKRRDFLKLAARLAVPAALLVCQADPEIIRQRLQERKGDVSDADWSIYLKAVEQWEEPGSQTRRALRSISTNGTSKEAMAQAAIILRELGLLG